jgi:hypothetical protein
MTVVACAAPPLRATSSEYQIQVQLERVGLGKREVTLELRDSTGQAITDARVEMLPIMEQHGMLSPPITLTHQQSGVYEHPALDLTMSGEWQLKCAITRAGNRSEITVPVMIE